MASLETRYQQELLGDIVPFWEQRIFGSAVWPSSEHDNGPAPAIGPAGHEVLGDALWLFSWLYNRCRAHPRWRANAAAIAQVVLREAASAIDGPPCGDARSAEPLAWLSLADGLREHADGAVGTPCLAVARQLVLRAAAESTATPRSPLECAGRVVLVGTEMVSRRADPEIQAAVESSVHAIIGAHRNDETELLEEQPRCPRAAPGVTVFGRSLDALWAVLRYARRRSDLVLAETCVGSIRRHVDIGWDAVFGGMAHAMRLDGGGFVWSSDERPSCSELETLGIGEYHYMKSAWTLAAVATATLEVLAWRRERWAADAFGRAQAVLELHFPARQYGARRYLVSADRRMSPTSVQASLDWAGSPRRLVASLDLLGRIRAERRRTL